MDHLEPIDFHAPGFGGFYDELPLWSAPFGLFLLERAPLDPGMRVLDVGAGTGFLSIELAERCGAQARVFAVDPWPEGVARLREKLAFRGLENVEVLEQDAAALDLPAGSIDLIVSNLGINNFEAPAAVLAACRRVARTGAPLLLTTNPVGHMAELYDVLRGVLEELALTASLPALEEHVAHRGTAASVSALLEAAGFAVERVGEREHRMRFANGGALLRHHLIRLGFLPDWKALVPGDRAVDVFALLERRLDELARERGEVSLRIPILCVEARRAG